MATFEELMEQYRNPGETGLPDNYLDELDTAYRNDLSVREAAISEREKQIAERDEIIEKERGETRRLKAVNYDLLVAAPKSREPGVTEQPDDAPRGIDSLFE